MAHKSGGPGACRATRPLRDIASLATASVHLDADGTLRLAPVGESLPGQVTGPCCWSSPTRSVKVPGRSSDLRQPELPEGLLRPLPKPWQHLV